MKFLKLVQIKKYAFKSFYENNKFSTKKFKLLESVNDYRIITPEIIVKNKNKNKGYLTEFIEGTPLSNANLSFGKKIYYLQEVKKLIIKLHKKQNIIQGNLHGRNIIIDDEEAYIIDFDNCKINNSKINKNKCLKDVEEYINKVGINKNLDIFTFNITTYSILYNCPFHLVRKNIYQENYGYFNNPTAKTICKSLLLENKKNLNNKFLIDYIH